MGTKRWLTQRNQSNPFKFLVARRPPRPLLIANAVRESFVSMVNLWNKLNPNPSNSNYKSQFCFSEKTDSPKLTSGSELRVVDVSLKFMLSDKLVQVFSCILSEIRR